MILWPNRDRKIDLLTEVRRDMKGKRFEYYNILIIDEDETACTEAVMKGYLAIKTDKKTGLTFQHLKAFRIA